MPLQACDEHVGVVGVPLVAPRLVHRTELLTLHEPSDRAMRLVSALRARARVL